MSSLPQQPGGAMPISNTLPAPARRGGPNMGGMGNPMADGHNQMHEQMMMQGGQGNGQQPNFGPMGGEPSIQPAVMGQQMYGSMDQMVQPRTPMDLQSQNYGNSLGTNSYNSNKLVGGTK